MQEKFLITNNTLVILFFCLDSVAADSFLDWRQFYITYKVKSRQLLSISLTFLEFAVTYSHTHFFYFSRKLVILFCLLQWHKIRSKWLPFNKFLNLYSQDSNWNLTTKMDSENLQFYLDFTDIFKHYKELTMACCS